MNRIRALNAGPKRRASASWLIAIMLAPARVPLTPGRFPKCTFPLTAGPPPMLKTILYVVLFAIVGVILFSVAAPLLFAPEDLRKAGSIAFPLIVIVCGTAGFVFGRRRRK